MTAPLRQVPAGRINGDLGLHAPDGAVLGPKAITREYVVITGHDIAGVTVGYATEADLDATAQARWVADPQTVTEARLVMAYQAPERARLRALLGPLRPAAGSVGAR